MRIAAGRLWSACALLGACVLVLSFGAAPAAAQPAAARTDTPESHELTEGTVKPSYGEAVGAPCTGGKGVTVCPMLVAAGDPNTVKGVFGTVKGKELKLSFCVSAEGVPEEPEIVQSTGKAKADREMMKFIRTYRYNPGTVDGVAARLCGVVAAFKF